MSDWPESHTAHIGMTGSGKSSYLRSLRLTPRRTAPDPLREAIERAYRTPEPSFLFDIPTDAKRSRRSYLPPSAFDDYQYLFITGGGGFLRSVHLTVTEAVRRPLTPKQRRRALHKANHRERHAWKYDAPFNRIEVIELPP